MKNYVCCTREHISGQVVLHVYGPTDQLTAEALGIRLTKAAAHAGAKLDFRVLQIEEVPSP